MNVLQFFKFAYKKRKQTAIKRKLSVKYADVINKYALEEKQGTDIPQNWLYPIWVCWWQGEENMPELVKCCYRSLCENANGHPVNLVTKDNYKSYVAIPDYILEKLDKGMITLTHFSDILRVSLLYEHGGMWVDATILITKPLPEYLDYAFYSIKHTAFYTVVPTNKGQHISGYRWVAFFLYSAKNNLLIGFMKDFFFAYWREEEKLIEYLLIDYVIALAYDLIPAATKMIDSIPYNNLRHNDLRYLLKRNSPYDPALFEEICSETYLHKLTWKKQFLEYTKKGEPTYYKHIVDHCNSL